MQNYGDIHSIIMTSLLMNIVQVDDYIDKYQQSLVFKKIKIIWPLSSLLKIRPSLSPLSYPSGHLIFLKY